MRRMWLSEGRTPTILPWLYYGRFVDIAAHDACNGVGLFLWCIVVARPYILFCEPKMPAPIYTAASFTRDIGIYVRLGNIVRQFKGCGGFVGRPRASTLRICRLALVGIFSLKDS